MRQTVLDEAVHAAQSCPSGRLTPLCWSAQLNPVVEREAFMLQGQRDAVPKLVKAIQQRCS